MTFPVRHAIAVASLLLCLPVVASADAASEVIALTRAQWAAEDAKKPAAEAHKDFADDYTEFNPVAPTRIEGKAMAGKAYEALNKVPGENLLAEMTNPKVQVYGDTAILTYNYVGISTDGDGKPTNNLAKSTRVYVRMNGAWKLVHANFAPVTVPEN